MAHEKILITGGAGFIASHLTQRLLADGCEVTAFDNLDDYYDPTLKRANIARFTGQPGYRFVQGDCTRAGDLAQLGHQRFDHIFHLGGRVGVRASLTDPAAYIHHNVHGTQQMLEFARNTLAGSFLFASSSSVYGDRRDGPFKETDSTDRPETVYAASKKAAELLCYAYHSLHRMNILCLRFFTVFGPRQRPDMAIAKFIRLIRNDQPIPLLGDPASARDYTFVEDTCEGLTSAMRSKIPFGIYNLGCGRPIRLDEMVEALGQALGKKPILDRQPKASGDVFLTYADISRAKADFQYAPRVSFQEGLRRSVESTS